MIICEENTLWGVYYGLYVDRATTGATNNKDNQCPQNISEKKWYLDDTIMKPNVLDS